MVGSNLLADGVEGKLESYSSSYFEILTKKGERFKVKYKKVYSDKFEIYRGNLHRFLRKLKSKNLLILVKIKLKIMNHPLLL